MEINIKKKIEIIFNNGFIFIKLKLYDIFIIFFLIIKII